MNRRSQLLNRKKNEKFLRSDIEEIKRVIHMHNVVRERGDSIKPKSNVWKYGIVLIVFFVVFSLSAQVYGYSSKGIEIKTPVNLENATQGLSEENREYIFGVHEFFEGSKFNGAFYETFEPEEAKRILEKN